MGVEKAVRTKQELSSQEISLATWTNVIKKKKKSQLLLYPQGRQKNHFKVNFIIVGPFYFSANIKKVGNTHYMSEESNMIITSL